MRFAGFHCLGGFGAEKRTGVFRHRWPTKLVSCDLGKNHGLSILRWALTLCLAAAAPLIILRSALGPLDRPVGVHSPLNAESIFAVSFLLLLTLRSRPFESAHSRSSAVGFIQTARVFALLLAISFLLYLPTLRSPLLHDSYGHLAVASGETFQDILRQFYTRQTSGDFFFRPIGYLTYFIDYRWAGANPVRWNAWNVIVHSINCTLVFVFARRIGATTFAALGCALLFCLHGSRPETVSWMAARFDLLATCFTLLALLCLQSYLKYGGWRLALLVIFTVLALLSKESAYCLPLLAILIAFKEEPSESKTRKIAVLAVTLTSAVLFAHRFWLVRGMGGYQTGQGQAAILRIDAVKTIKALLYREWGLLFFPVNWSFPLPWWATAALLGYLAGLVFIAIRGRMPRRRTLLTLGMVIAASLPVQHLLLLGPDLSGARVLYLPALGFCLLFCVWIDCLSHKWSKLLLCVAVLGFQTAILEHNLAIWKQVAVTGRQTCEAVGQAMSGNGKHIDVAGIPAQLHGVFFVRNAFPMCVAFNTGQDASRVSLVDDVYKSPPENVKLTWNSRTEKLERVSTN